MTREWSDQVLRDILRGIGGEAAEATPALTDAVLTRIAEEPLPVRSAAARARARVSDAALWVRARYVRLAAILVALVFGVAVSPVGAQVADWFDFHGVLVGPGRDDSGDSTPTVPPVEGQLTLAEAMDLVAFEPLVPADLAAPDAVQVSRDRQLLSMSWGKGIHTIRLDQFDGGLEPRFYKAADEVRVVEIGFRDALWFPTPHHVDVLASPGDPVRIRPRLAAQTLIWEADGVTLRLEGRFSAAEAESLAESAR